MWNFVLKLKNSNIAKAIYLNTMRAHAPKGTMFFRVNPGQDHYVTRGGRNKTN